MQVRSQFAALRRETAAVIVFFFNAGSRKVGKLFLSSAHDISYTAESTRIPRRSHL